MSAAPTRNSKTVAGSNDEMLSRFTASISRQLALADDKLAALAIAAREASDAVERGAVTKADAVDALYAAALAYGLPLHGDDVVQGILARGFAERRPR